MEFHTKLLKHITFSQTVPEGYTYAFTPGIFHTKKHLELQGNLFSGFYILHKKKKKVEGHIFFHKSASKALSPGKASFGGFELSYQLDLSVLWAFVNYFEEILEKEKIEKLLITLPPAALNLNTFAKVQEVLLKKGYSITRSEIGATIMVAKDEFKKNTSIHLKRRLKQCHSRNFATSLVKHSKLGEIYNFILECRLKKKQELSMSLEELTITIAAFPDQFRLFAVYDGEIMIAASICILISPEVLYNFYSAHDAEYDKWSPVVMLLEYIYNHSREINIKMIDLGTSAVSGKPNFSLLHFKEHLGAVLSPKYTFSKSLN